MAMKRSLGYWRLIKTYDGNLSIFRKSFIPLLGPLSDNRELNRKTAD
jgi:hypothetical protein